MLLDAIGTRRLVFSGGKGGVGKTSTAAAIALGLTRAGGRVLLVSTDPAHNLGHVFERRIGDRVTRVAPDLDALELDPDDTVRSHLARVSGTLARLMPPGSGDEVARHMSRARHAPGMAEAALLDRLADLARGLGADHDRLVVDTAPTGHTLALLSLPEMMTAWTDGLLANRTAANRFEERARQLSGAKAEGRGARDAEIRAILGQRRERLAGLRARLTDSRQTAFVLVTTPERMPILETAALAGGLAASGMTPSALLVNRVRGGLGPDALEDRLAPLDRALRGVPRFAADEQPDEPMGVQGISRLAGAIRSL